MVTVDLPAARRLAVTIVVGQALVAVAIALLCLGFSGTLAAKSALLGGGINVLASGAMVLLAFGRSGGADAMQIARSFYIGEGLKLVIMIAGFILVLTTLKVSMVALFCAYVATFFVYWAALANVLPPLGGAPVRSIKVDHGN